MASGSQENKEAPPDWSACLPTNAGNVYNITDEAVWALSSCKIEGFGINELLDDRTDLYWQSEGPQPHTITVEFQRKTDISFVMMYLDHKVDESYTPSRVQVQVGNSILDLEEPVTVNFQEPVGWQAIDLRNEDRPVRGFIVVIQILQNHQSGRDTHVRSIRVLGPSKASLDVWKRPLPVTEHLGPYFSDPFHNKNIFSHSLF